jgi:hypothetical protein
LFTDFAMLHFVSDETTDFEALVVVVRGGRNGINLWLPLFWRKK